MRWFYKRLGFCGNSHGNWPRILFLYDITEVWMSFLPTMSCNVSSIHFSVICSSPAQEGHLSAAPRFSCIGSHRADTNQCFRPTGFGGLARSPLNSPLWRYSCHEEVSCPTTSPLFWLGEPVVAAWRFSMRLFVRSLLDRENSWGTGRRAPWPDC